ncbi:MAG TPA: amino acid adenylation domain-containing protein, partial [Symbiobacteriaceae bacterium]|nr:amino acid adenylation domain-containing protein [Symbiobacteriaceae bacterium]
FGGLTMTPFPMTQQEGQFDLTLELGEVRGAIDGAFKYNTDLFDQGTIARLARHFETLLEALAAEPDRPVLNVPVMPHEEESLVVKEWNRTEANFPADRCAYQLVAERAAMQPGAPAVVAGDRVLTYGELNAQANRLARRLQQLGVGPDVPVAICLDRSPEAVIAQLAVWKAGGCYVPLDPAYPVERLRFMLADLGEPVLITRSDGPVQPEKRICIDAEALTEPDHDLPPLAGPDNLAYIIYTSGSTGTPKGVEIEHRALLNMLFWHRKAYGVTAADRMTLVAGPGFDATVWELWPYLTAGAALHIPSDETRLDPARMRDWLVASAITVTFLPTPLAEAVMALDWPAGIPLRTVQAAGDKLNHYPRPDLPFRLTNNYGPTENTVVATWCPVLPGGAPGTAPPIGQPTDNVQIYILDGHLQPVPIGVPGELCIAGEQLARGYHNRPELTAEKFPAHPFAPGRRIYRTGDLARYLPDGAIEFLGRIDDQIKLRGFRIELGEIETCLAQHPAVRQAAVAVRSGPGGEKALVGYVIAGDGAAPTGQELRSYLKERLPEYMVPVTCMFLDRLPLTPNGKVDRKALPMPEALRAEPVAYVAPRSALERTVSGVWQELLGLEQVGLNDNFFDLGGTSMLVARAQAALSAQLGREVPIIDLFKYPTVVSLAAYLSGGETTEGAPDRTEAIAAGKDRLKLRMQKRQGARP